MRIIVETEDVKKNLLTVFHRNLCPSDFKMTNNKECVCNIADPSESKCSECWQAAGLEIIVQEVNE